MPRDELLMNNLCLTLSRSRRRHAPVQLSVSRPNDLIQAGTVEPRLLGKNFLTLDVDCLITQLSSGRTKPMARIVMQMPWLDYYSFYSLRHFMTDLRCGAHCVYNINIHLVLIVAYRRKAITRAILSTIQEVLHRILDRLEIRILNFSGEADHIHLLVSIPPRYAISDLVNRIKTATSRAIRQKHAKAIAPFLWGNRFWSNSYCAVSVGDGRSIESIKRYIQGQKLPS